jgi:hypothetical protein
MPTRLTAGDLSESMCGKPFGIYSVLLMYACRSTKGNVVVKSVPENQLEFHCKYGG